MNTKFSRVVYRLFSGMPIAKNRFYKEARAVYNPVEGVYNIYLDKHCLVTPKRKPVNIHSEALALAVAEEWNMQENEIRKNLMRLTGLTFTVIDNPVSLQKSDLLSQVLQFLDKDTVLYRLEENINLLKLEETRWDPVIEWVSWEYGLSVRPSYSLVEEAVIDSNSRIRLGNQLSDYSFSQLLGLQYATESLKSVFLTLAVVSCRLDAREAVELALLEQEYQTDIWGKVEWAHDIEREELISRLSAGILFMRLGDFQEETKYETVKNDTNLA